MALGDEYATHPVTGQHYRVLWTSDDTGRLQASAGGRWGRAKGGCPGAARWPAGSRRREVFGRPTPVCLAPHPHPPPAQVLRAVPVDSLPAGRANGSSMPRGAVAPGVGDSDAASSGPGSSSEAAPGAVEMSRVA